MSLYSIIFYAISIIIVISAFTVVFSKNMIYSAISLFFTLFGVAGIFILLFADFLAVTQIIVYIGGVLVLLVFGIMLTSNITDVSVKVKGLNPIPAIIFVVVMVVLLIYTLINTYWNVSDISKNEITVNQIGILLLTNYLLPFEVASVLLLIALIGAAMFARKSK